ncbi:uncharacterized protein [Parasteatoda tepidariorum]|uniref:uncharacterized protein n=1 Tax=Parasteatoda tepidariorum TaxID=114398 RepID=UPI001C71C326|nr:uncharacterized protein LOC122269836 [Parasteatoda tepidariorum]
MAENSKVLCSAHHSKNSGTTSTPNDYAQYFLIKLNNPTIPDTSFSKVSPFLIHKALLSVLGEVTSVKKIRSGDLLIQVSSSKQADTLSKCNVMCSFDVTVTPHNTLNSSRGVISESEFLNDTEEMILEELQEQNVTAVRRIKIRRDGKLIPTKHLILTFSKPQIPSSIKMAWHNCPVRPYVPNPLRCFQCQRFGHSKQSCRGQPVCARCSGTGHCDTSCELPSLCINCKGDHVAYSRSCPKWSLEKEIQTVKVLQNLTFNEARRIVTARTPRPGVSYSTAVKTSYCSVSTQTDSVTQKCSTNKQIKLPTPRPQFNFTEPSTSNRTTSPPPSKTSKLDNSEKNRPCPKQIPSKKLPPSLKPGYSRKKKDAKYIQPFNQPTSADLQKMDVEVELSLHPSDDECLLD